MREEEILKILSNKKAMDLYLCEADFIKEFCKLATFFNLQILSFIVAKLCEDSGLKQEDISEMVIKAWAKNMDKTVDVTIKGTPEHLREGTTEMMVEAKRLATNYIKTKLDLPPSTEDLEKMFKDL